jgi:hypothetical protein
METLSQSFQPPASSLQAGTAIYIGHAQFKLELCFNLTTVSWKQGLLVVRNQRALMLDSMRVDLLGDQHDYNMHTELHLGSSAFWFHNWI